MCPSFPLADTSPAPGVRTTLSGKWSVGTLLAMVARPFRLPSRMQTASMAGSSADLRQPLSEWLVRTQKPCSPPTALPGPRSEDDLRATSSCPGGMSSVGLRPQLTRTLGTTVLFPRSTRISTALWLGGLVLGLPTAAYARPTAPTGQPTPVSVSAAAGSHRDISGSSSADVTAGRQTPAPAHTSTAAPVPSHGTATPSDDPTMLDGSDWTSAEAEAFWTPERMASAVPQSDKAAAESAPASATTGPHADAAAAPRVDHHFAGVPSVGVLFSQDQDLKTATGSTVAPRAVPG